MLLATRSDPECFGELYRRREDAILAFMLRRVGNAELAADLTAETFATALLHVGRFDTARGTASAWLFGIARNVLGHSVARRQVQDRARRRLGMSPITLSPDVLTQIEALEGDVQAVAMLSELPQNEANAVKARVVDGESYQQIAVDLQCSPQVARKRVSRGLARLRARKESA